MDSSEYALVSPSNEVIKTVWLEGEPPMNLAPGKPRWLPVVNVDIIYGPDTSVLVGPKLTVEDGRVTRSYDLREKNAEEVSAMTQSKMIELSEQFYARTMAPIKLSTELSGLRTFDADTMARQRVMGILLIIMVSKLFNQPFPDSRPWTPHGSLTSVEMTQRDFVNLTLAVATREDQLFIKKKTLEASLIGVSSNASLVAAFNTSNGWD